MAFPLCSPCSVNKPYKLSYIAPPVILFAACTAGIAFSYFKNYQRLIIPFAGGAFGSAYSMRTIYNNRNLKTFEENNVKLASSVETYKDSVNEFQESKKEFTKQYEDFKTENSSIQKTIKEDIPKVIEELNSSIREENVQFDANLKTFVKKVDEAECSKNNLYLSIKEIQEIFEALKNQFGDEK